MGTQKRVLAKCNVDLQIQYFMYVRIIMPHTHTHTSNSKSYISFNPIDVCNNKRKMIAKRVTIGLKMYIFAAKFF